MKLQNAVSPKRTGESAITSERALQLCNLAKLQEESGDFENARATISDYWQRVGDRPRVDGLDDIGRAEVLLRAGALYGLDWKSPPNPRGAGDCQRSDQRKRFSF